MMKKKTESVSLRLITILNLKPAFERQAITSDLSKEFLREKTRVQDNV